VPLIDAEDAASDAIVKILGNPADLERLEHLEHHRAWFITQAGWRLWDTYKQEQNRRTREAKYWRGQPEADVPIDEIIEHEAADEDQDGLADLTSAARLTDKQLDLLRMLTKQEKSIADIALAMNISERAVRAMAKRLRTKLQASIDKRRRDGEPDE